MDPIETIMEGEWRVDIFYDEDPSSPADWDNVGILAYSTRDAGVGDMPSDPYGNGPFEVDCPACDGDGEWYGEDEDGARTDEVTTCQTCRGECYVTDGAMLAKHLHGAVVCLPVEARDGYNGADLRIADGWEEANGWIYATAETIATTGVPLDSVAAALESELQAWEQWAQGDVYGVVVTGPDGVVDESVWGFYGLGETIDEARAMLRASIDHAAREEAKIDRMMHN